MFPSSPNSNAHISPGIRSLLERARPMSFGSANIPHGPLPSPNVPIPGQFPHTSTPQLVRPFPKTSPLRGSGYGDCMSIPGSQSRSFDQFHSERAYLLSALQQQNLTATDLLREIPQLEYSLCLSEISFTRKKSRKRMNWLRRRLEETTRQERTILARLGQLTHEIQARERWNRVEYERLQQELSQQGSVPYGFNLAQANQAMSNIPLNPAVPDFVPRRYPSISGLQVPQLQQTHSYTGPFRWDQNPWKQPAELSESNYHDEAISPKSVRSKNDFLAPETEKATRPLLSHRTVSMNNAELDMWSIRSDYPPLSKIKRHSLPTLQGLLT